MITIKYLHIKLKQKNVLKQRLKMSMVTESLPSLFSHFFSATVTLKRFKPTIFPTALFSGIGKFSSSSVMDYLGITTCKPSSNAFALSLGSLSYSPPFRYNLNV
jgi:hypothetical protein